MDSEAETVILSDTTSHGAALSDACGILRCSHEEQYT